MSETAPGPRLLHGLLPLLLDADIPGSYRLGWPGDAQDADVVRDVTDLPDHEMTLKAFPNEAARSGYVTAIADLGDNAVSCATSHAQSPIPPLLLVVRHDRPRRPGGTLEEVIHLSGATASAAEEYSVLWNRHARDVARTEAGARHGLRWASEILAIRRHAGIMLDTNVERDTVSFHAGSSTFVLRKEGGGLRVEWEVSREELPADLEAARSGAIRAAGAVEVRRGTLSMATGEIDDDVIRGILGTGQEAVRAISALAWEAKARLSLATLSRSRSARRAAEGLVAGRIVLWAGRVSPAHQPSGDDAPMVAIVGETVHEMLRLGIATLAWRPAMHTPGPWGTVGGFVGPTAMTAAFLSGDLQAVAASAPSPSEFLDMEPEPDLAMAMAGLRPLVGDEALATLHRSGEDLDAPVGKGTPGEWLAFATRLLAGGSAPVVGAGRGVGA